MRKTKENLKIRYTEHFRDYKKEKIGNLLNDLEQITKSIFSENKEMREFLEFFQNSNSSRYMIEIGLLKNHLKMAFELLNSPTLSF